MWRSARMGCAWKAPACSYAYAHIIRAIVLIDTRMRQRRLHEGFVDAVYWRVRQAHERSPIRTPTATLMRGGPRRRVCARQAARLVEGEELLPNFRKAGELRDERQDPLLELSLGEEPVAISIVVRELPPRPDQRALPPHPLEEVEYRDATVAIKRQLEKV